MKRRQHQQMVESDRAPYPYPRSQPQREGSSVRLSLLIGIVILGLLLIAVVILGILSLFDVIHGHPGATWNAWVGAWNAVKWWLLAGVGGVVALHVLKERSRTAMERAEADVKRAEARRIRRETDMLSELHDHNMDHMPSVYFHRPDLYGNYAQPIDADGHQTSMILPGNAGESVTTSGISPQFLRDWLDAQRMVEGEKEEDLPQIEGPAIDPRTVTAPTLEEDLAAGRIRLGESMTMGYRLIQDEFTGRWRIESITDPDDASMFICAASTAGKSTLVAMMMARMAARGDTVYVVIDPHKNNPEKSIMAKVMPALEPWLAYPVVWGKDAKELAGVVKYLRDLIALRQGPDTVAKQRHLLRGLKVRVIIDEALILASITRQPKHDKVFDDLLRLMQEMAVGTAKDEINYIAMAQLATKEQMGDIDIRDVCPKTIILKTPKQSGLALNLPAELANMAHYFPRGRGFYIGDADEPELFIWGNASTAGIAQVAAISTSPLAKTGRESRVINLFSLPTIVDEENGFEALESGWKEDGKRVGNQFPAAIQAELDKIDDWAGKLDRLKPVLGEDLADVVYPEVWGVRPGRSEVYQKAREEYKVLMAAVRWQLENAS